MDRSVAGILISLILCAGGLRADEPAAAAPPRQTLGLTFAAAASARLDDQGRGDAGRQSELDAGASLLERRPVGTGPWYCGWGAQTQQYDFGGAPALGVGRLQEVSAQFSLEYYIRDEAVASASVRPGYYYQDHAISSSWDAPVQIVSGIPIADGLSGVVGGSDGRLFHHPIPIGGVVWKFSPQVRVEAVYPEPALVIGLHPGLEFRLGGELSGDGFMARAGTTRTRMEFYAYRVSASLAWRLSRGAKLTAGAAAEVERVFDFYEIGRRLRARPTAGLELGLELFR